jgi:hypothetical protein
MHEVGFSSAAEFIQSLGYRNTDRGLRRLKPWMEQGHGYEKIIKQITAAYPGYAEELGKAILETEAVRDAEFEADFLEHCKSEQATFVPFIHAEGERSVPSGITMFGISGGHRRWTTIQLPQETMALPFKIQLTKLTALMAAYKRKYNGCCPFFGKLTGFKLVLLTTYYQSGAEGQFLEHVQRPFRNGECWAELR